MLLNFTRKLLGAALHSCVGLSFVNGLEGGVKPTLSRKRDWGACESWGSLVQLDARNLQALGVRAGREA